MILALLLLLCSALRAPPVAGEAGSSSIAPVDVAITIDDLPAHGVDTMGVSRLEIAQRVLATLRKHHVPRVFGFVNGVRLEDDADLGKVLEAWRAAGYPLGNHSYSHVDPNETPLPAYFADIEKNEPVLARFGFEKVFRYPFLFEGDSPERRDQTAGWLRAHGYRKADVTIDFDDWAWGPAWSRCVEKHDEVALGELRHMYLEASVRILDRSREMARLLAGREIAHVLLLHLGAPDADQLDAMLTSYEAAGVRWVPLEQAQKDPIYAEDPGFVTKWGWTLLDRLVKVRHVEATNKFWPNEDRLEQICK
jgi:peptidoglycan/xylan/chitin deacetylase (PgdA/CDA1 family)